MKEGKRLFGERGSRGRGVCGAGGAMGVGEKRWSGEHNSTLMECNGGAPIWKGGRPLGGRGWGVVNV